LNLLPDEIDSHWEKAANEDGPVKYKFFLNNMTVLVLPVLLSVITLGSFAIIITQGYIITQIDQNNETTLIQVQESFESLFSDIDSITTNLNLNTNFILRCKALLEGTLQDDEKIPVRNTFMNLINTVSNASPYIQFIYLYCNNDAGNVLVSNQNIVNISASLDNSWYDTYLNMKGQVLVQNRMVKRYTFEKEVPMVSVYKKFNAAGRSNTQGVVVLNVKRQYVEDVLSRLLSASKQAIMVVNSRGELVASVNNTSIGIQTASFNDQGDLHLPNKDEFIVSHSDSPRFGLKYVSVIRKSDLYSLPLQLVRLTGIIAGLSLLCGLFLAYFSTKRNYRNIDMIIRTFNAVEQNTPLPEMPRHIGDAYSSILHSITNSFVATSKLKFQLVEKKYEMKALEMMALQAQIHPHFLNNTLKTIYWKTVALTGNQNEAAKMIETLSAILSYSLTGSQELVPLKHEISYVRSYLEIQKVRYRDKFNVFWLYDEALIDIPVMKMLFQPILENAIYHGINEKETSGMISVRIRHHEGRLRIVVIDDGRGMEKEKLNGLKEQLLNSRNSVSHIGLPNIIRRLNLIYDQELYYSIKSIYGVGTAVYISFPEEIPEGSVPPQY
jgi:two-component system sensor histidine kinase YesM